MSLVFFLVFSLSHTHTHTLTLSPFQAVDSSEYEAMCKGLRSPNPPPITDDLSRWLNEAQWAALDVLTTLPAFANLAKDMEKSTDDWFTWCGLEAPERAAMPGDWTKLSEFKQLLIVRALRPDRITNALSNYCEKIMGSDYVNQEAFIAETMMAESSSSTPIFFILFPGYSPSKEIEEYAKKVGHTSENGKLTLISMGQGQEGPAEAVLDRYTKDGGWVFLDNVHLMQVGGNLMSTRHTTCAHMHDVHIILPAPSHTYTHIGPLATFMYTTSASSPNTLAFTTSVCTNLWALHPLITLLCMHALQGWVPRLERKLEIAAETAHPDFRCFFSAEPINGAPFAKIVPESILQTCIKISNEPPSDMKSNMRRAFNAFTEEQVGLLHTTCTSRSPGIINNTRMHIRAR